MLLNVNYCINYLLLNRSPGARRILQGRGIRRLIVAFEHVILPIAVLISLVGMNFSDGNCLRCGIGLPVISGT